MFQEFISEEDTVTLCSNCCKCNCYKRKINHSISNFQESYKLINRIRDKTANLSKDAKYSKFYNYIKDHSKLVNERLVIEFKLENNIVCRDAFALAYGISEYYLQVVIFYLSIFYKCYLLIMHLGLQ